MPHFPPPPKLPPQMARFQRVPPAIFPPVLGLLGLVSAWGHATRVFSLPTAPVELATGAVTLLFAFCTIAYISKLMHRPGVVVEDLRTLPGRTGLAAWCIAMIVQAALLAALSPVVAKVLIGIGGVSLLAIALFVLPLRLRGTDTAGPITPAMHLVFVGFILIPGAAMPVKMGTDAMPWLIWYCTAAGLFITALTIRPLLFGEGAPPLRPLQAIQLAPASFVAIGAMLTEQFAMAGFALAWATLVAVLLLFRLRWLMEGGFSGFWSAFTFPVTALAGACLLCSEAFGLDSFRVAGGVILVATTLYIPVIAYKILKLWSNGTLGAKTNAAIA